MLIPLARSAKVNALDMPANLYLSGQVIVGVNGPGASRRRPRRTQKYSGQSVLAPFACCTFLGTVFDFAELSPY